MTFELTPAQKDAVYSNAPETVAIAAAGSGKTGVLTLRYARLLAEGAPVRSVLALTFTEKAAAEMRERVRRELRAPSEAVPEIAALPEERRRALVRAVSDARISTIHAFCAGLLREHGLEAGLDPAFAVAEAWRADEMKEAAWASAIERTDAGRPEDMEALRALGIFDAYEDFVRFYGALRASGAAPEGLAIDLGDGAPFDLQAALAAHVSVLRAAGADKNVHHATRKALNERAGKLEGIRPEHLEHPLKICAFLHGVTFTSTSADAQRLSDEIAATASAVLADWLRDRAPAFLRFAGTFDAAYRAEKDAAGCLDFSDLELYARGLLAARPDLPREMGLAHLLVDEHQDTNPLQEEILASLGGLAQFVVGDPAQAIYAFRHADPRLLEARAARAERAGGRVTLRVNYRSRPEILDFVNFVCGREGEDALLPHRARVGGARVEVAVARADTVDEARELEARWIAARIAERIGETFTDRKDRTRRLGPGDAVLLLRTGARAAVYERALAAAGLPARIDRGGSLHESQEAAELAALLASLGRPEDDLATAVVLRSPLCGVSDFGLFLLRGAGLARALPERIGLLEGEDRERLARFLAWHPRLLALAGRLPADRLLAEAMAASDYLARLAAAPDGADRARRAERLADLVSELAPGAGPREAAERLAALRARAEPERLAATEEADGAVRILTVHAAKGLEFPAVFVADALNPGGGSKAPQFLFERPSRCALAVPNPYAAPMNVKPRRGAPASYQAMREEMQRRSAEENARLLYVALTRAEERLWLTASAGKTVGAGWARPAFERLGWGPKEDFPEAREERRDGASVYGVQTIRAAEAARAAPSAREAVASAEIGPILEAALRPPPAPSAEPYLATVSELLASEEAARPVGVRAGGLGPALREDEAETAPEALALGSAAHGALEAWRPEEGRAALERVAGRACRDFGLDPQRAAPLLVRWVEGFWASDLGRRCAASAEARRELPLTFRAGGLTVRGAIDLLFREADGSWTLVDYKSSPASPEAEARYAAQLRLYALGLAASGLGEAGAAALFFLREGRAAPVDVGPEALRSAEALAEDYLRRRRGRVA